MQDGTANLLGALGLAVADRIERVARDVMDRAGQTPAALVVIGYGRGPSNDRLRRVLDLSHPGAVRLVDRLVADGLVERRRGADRRKVALYLTDAGQAKREALLAGRLSAMEPLVSALDPEQCEQLDTLLRQMLASLPLRDLDKQRLCRLCDDRVCDDCPIPADFKA